MLCGLATDGIVKQPTEGDRYPWVVSCALQSASCVPQRSGHGADPCSGSWTLVMQLGCIKLIGQVYYGMWYVTIPVLYLLIVLSGCVHMSSLYVGRSFTAIFTSQRKSVRPYTVRNSWALQSLYISFLWIQQRLKHKNENIFSDSHI